MLHVLSASLQLSPAESESDILRFRKPKGESQKPKAESRKPKAESRKPKAESRKLRAENLALQPGRDSLIALGGGSAGYQVSNHR